MFIADGQHCKLVSIIAQETELGTEEDHEFSFQLGIQTSDNSVVICFTSAALMTKWLVAIEDLVSNSP